MQWFCIERIYWKAKQFLVLAIVINDNCGGSPDNQSEFWLRICYLKQEVQQILQSRPKRAWLNDCIMDPGKKLQSNRYQMQKNPKILYQHLQHGNVNIWFVSFCSNDRVQSCESLNSFLSGTSKMLA